MATRREKARKKYRSNQGADPTDSQLTSFMATLPSSFFSDCSDFYSSSSYGSSSFDSGSSSSFDSGSSGGGDCGGGGF